MPGTLASDAQVGPQHFARRGKLVKAAVARLDVKRRAQHRRRVLALHQRGGAAVRGGLRPLNIGLREAIAPELPYYPSLLNANLVQRMRCWSRLSDQTRIYKIFLTRNRPAATLNKWINHLFKLKSGHGRVRHPKSLCPAGCAPTV